MTCLSREIPGGDMCEAPLLRDLCTEDAYSFNRKPPHADGLREE